jgi:hypothetical protein
VTGLFPNAGFGQNEFLNTNALTTVLPWFGAVRGLSLYGGMFATINQKYQTPQTGVLVTGTANVTTTWDIKKSFEDAVWVAGFHRFFWEIEEKTGYFMIFGGASTASQVSNDPHDFIFKPGQGIASTDKKKP